MAWEERARGGRYYVRKRWRNGRCVSEYIGGGAAAAAAARRDDWSRRRRDAVRQKQRAACRREEEGDALLDVVTDVAGTLATAALLAAGCHTHKGTWRRKRG